MSTPACRDADLEAFFPTVGGDVTPALRICLEICAAVNGLDYVDACAASGLVQPSDADAGVLGGCSEKQRQMIRRGHTTIEAEWAKNRARLGIGQVAA